MKSNKNAIAETAESLPYVEQTRAEFEADD